jgi:hypothetical protein
MPDRSDCGLQKERKEVRTCTLKKRLCPSVRCSCSGNRWLTLKYDNPVGKVRCHDKIVLDYEGGLLCVKNETVGITLAYTLHEKGARRTA